MIKGLEKYNSNKSPWKDQFEKRKANKHWLRKSQSIALSILEEIKSKGISQKSLAEHIGVSPQQVNKWVSGKENFTLDSVSKIELALGVELIWCEKPKDSSLDLNFLFDALINQSYHDFAQEYLSYKVGRLSKTRKKVSKTEYETSYSMDQVSGIPNLKLVA